MSNGNNLLKFASAFAISYGISYAVTKAMESSQNKNQYEQATNAPRSIIKSANQTVPYDNTRRY